jgi:hypothetical protein
VHAQHADRLGNEADHVVHGRHDRHRPIVRPADLVGAGLRTPGELIKQWDFDTGLGGPVKRDALWYFISARDEGQHRTIPGIYPNLNAGDATKFSYVPDTTKEARGAESWQLAAPRHLAGQSSHKFNF